MGVPRQVPQHAAEFAREISSLPTEASQETHRGLRDLMGRDKSGGPSAGLGLRLGIC